MENLAPMKLAQRNIRWLARLMLGLAFCAQGIVAAHACVAPGAGPAQAYVVAHDDAAMPCHEEPAPGANACLTHCTQSDQISVDQHNAALAAPVSVIAWTITPPPEQSVRPSVVFEQLALNTGPPIPIRFCSFLN